MQERFLFYSLSFLPYPSSPLLFSSSPLSLPLEVGPLKSGYGVSCAVSSPQWRLGLSSSRSRFCCILPLNLTSGGNIFNDFLQN